MILPVCLLLLAAPSPTPVGGSGQNAKLPYSLSINTAQNVVKAGSEIRVHIVETNISDGPVLWEGASTDLARGGEINYKVYVFDDKGALAPQTEWGAYMVSGKQPPNKTLLFTAQGGPTCRRVER